jgi:hypothetical protein
MAHTHEFDCVVCGAHFDTEKDLQQHNEATHVPKLAIDPRAPAEPMGTEHKRVHDETKRGDSRDQNPPRTTTGDHFAAPKFGSAGSGGAEYEPGPERD